MKTKTRNEALKGIKVKRVQHPPRMTEVFRALRVGDQVTLPFSHKQAPYSFARAAGIKITTRLITQKKGVWTMEVERRSA